MIFCVPNKTKIIYLELSTSICEKIWKSAKYGDMEQDYNQNFVQVDKEHWDIFCRNVCEMVLK